MAIEDFAMYLVIAAGGIEMKLQRDLYKHIQSQYPHIWHQAYSYNRQPGTPVRSDYIRAMLKNGELATNDDPKLRQYRQRRRWLYALVAVYFGLWLLRFV
ncbi:hypothetical protein MJ923_12175 [Shewanella sp. 3B26]|uniref:Uncharacterized protein n=1 Tax=Shewanella zhuhaiensis TaxID=2919576 RepID=A0AAJ1F0X5_9GAMM|nr:hypothetical protein [Shewanella zhuhaiensis]MCH4295057.1 hypothetical protein [Shewanella zhuhaiensis]